MYSSLVNFYPESRLIWDLHLVKISTQSSLFRFTMAGSPHQIILVRTSSEFRKSTFCFISNVLRNLQGQQVTENLDVTAVIPTIELQKQ